MTGFMVPGTHNCLDKREGGQYSQGRGGQNILTLNVRIKKDKSVSKISTEPMPFKPLLSNHKDKMLTKLFMKS